MHRHKIRMCGHAAAVLVATLVAPAWTAEPDTSSWKCEYCPFADGQQAEYALGASFVSDDAAYFGDATGYDEQGGYANVDGTGFYVADSHRVAWLLEDLALDSRLVRVEGGQPGKYDYRFGYSELPRRRFDTTSTVFSQVADDRLALPDDWLRAGSTSGFTALDRSLFGKKIESDRQTLSLGGSYLPTGRFEVFADYRHSEQDGVGIQGGSFFTTASLLARPFDYQTDAVDLGVRFGGNRAVVELAYYGSFFQDKNLSLTWENPFTGAEAGRLAQPPDSSFQQIMLSGTYRTDWYDTILSFSGAVGKMEQDDALLPYTVNPSIASQPLPRTTLDGEVDTTNLAFTLTARPHRRARVKLAYRYDDRDNQTPVEMWNRVIVDSFNSADIEENVPYSFERTRLSLSADVDVASDFRLSAGYDYTELNRDFQEVEDQNEESGWGQVRWRPNSYLDLRARGGTARREADNYDISLAAALGQNPLLRRYHLAYRFRKFGEVTVVAPLPELPISVTGTAMFANDSYTESVLGLLDSDELRLAADLNWSISPRSSLYVMAGYDEIESEQVGSEFFAAPDWRATQSDELFNFGGGFRVTQLGERYDLEIDYTRADGTGEIDVVAANNGMSRFPDLESTLDSLRLRVRYRASKRLTGSLDLRYESFSAEDWALEGVQPATIPEVLTLGADPYDYDVFVIGLGVTYRLGADEPPAGRTNQQ